MAEPREARSIIESAEQAAAAGNCASAEDLLREVAPSRSRRWARTIQTSPTR